MTASALTLFPFRPKTLLHKLLLQPSIGRKAKILKMAAMQVIYILWQVRAQVLIFVPIFLLLPYLSVLCSSQEWHSPFPQSTVNHPTHSGDVPQHTAEKSCCSGSKSQLAAVIWLHNFPLHNAVFGISHYCILNWILCDSVWFPPPPSGKLKRKSVLNWCYVKCKH